MSGDMHLSSTRGTASPKVALVQMPWATTTRPSISLGILARLCQQSGVAVRTLYPNMDMAATIGFEAAGRLANERALYGLSEHLFAVDLFGRERLDSEQFLDVLARIGTLPKPFNDRSFIVRLRDEVIPRFLDETVKRVLAEGPTVVGVTATFNQVMASLALGARIKAVRPDVHLIAGGACFDDEMGQEYHRALPHVLDHVFLGEAEISFCEYLSRIKRSESTAGIPGVTYYEDGVVKLIRGEPLSDMNQSPTPDYDDFFREQQRIQAETGKIFNIEFIPFESSRGCWWGQKNHCVFCGINRDLMNFRSKTTDRVIQEIVSLAARYRVNKLTSTDWIISRVHRAEIFQRLKDLDLDLEIFYEVRADMAKWEIQLMKDAGVVHVQPGIESLSTPLLKLMKKGTTAIRHIQFLRFCKEVGVHLSYNILAGFPGERSEWYLEMAKLIPKIIHVQPPLHNLHFVEMHRFSPLFARRGEFAIDTHALRADYRFNFPPDTVDPLKIGYFFQFDSTSLVERSEYVDVVRREIDVWLKRHKETTPPVYEYIIGPGFLRINDTRHGEGRYLHLSGIHQDVVLLCDEVKKRSTLARDLATLYPREVADGTLDRVIDELLAADVLMSEDEWLLTLPIGHRMRTTEQLREYVLGASQATAADAPEARA